VSPREPEPVEKRKLRNKWTVNEVAWVLGVAPNTVWRWLSGEHYPTTQMMRRIQEKFHWSAADQFEHIPSEGHDIRYGMVFRSVLDELTEDLPPVPDAAKRVRSRTQGLSKNVATTPPYEITPGKGIKLK
jgi:transcriptional regulator with XRE-family HTH domain